MKVYELLLENGFIIENLNEENEFLICNGKKEFFLNFLNKKGFKIQDPYTGISINREINYEHGNDLFSGRVKIIFIKDFTEQIHFRFECQKTEK